MGRRTPEPRIAKMTPRYKINPTYEEYLGVPVLVCVLGRAHDFSRLYKARQFGNAIDFWRYVAAMADMLRRNVEVYAQRHPELLKPLNVVQ